MQLRTYRKLVDQTLESVAKAAGLPNASVVHRHENGKAFPSATQIERYREWSKNAITERDWHELRLERETERGAGAAATTQAQEAHNA